MQYKFLNIFLDKKELLSQTKNAINPFLLENNASQIEKIYNFYKSNINLLYVNGFLGTGKSNIVDYSTSFLSDDTIVLKYNCFNSTILDDILLSFFKEFRKLSSQNIITEPRIKSENFAQKINSYFSQIEKSFVIILDSFEEILEENRQEIIDFILHLNSMQKIKIIVIGRTFENKYFKDASVERVTILGLDKKIFEKYLKTEKIKSTSGLIDELYKHSRGYFFFTTLSINLMKQDNMSLYDFLIKLRNSFLPLKDFLEKQGLALTSSREKKLFSLLTIIRHPLDINLLKKLNLYNEDEIKFLTDNFILLEKNSQIYVQNYFREGAYDEISAHVLQKLHLYIIDLYSSQLPLKPLERDICISRQTMRKEIEYHKMFLPKKPKNIDNASIDINYLPYSKIINLEKPTEQESKQEKESPSSAIELPKKKNIKINLENLPFQETKKEIAQIKESKYNEKLYLTQEEKTNIVEDFENLTLDDILQKAKQAEIKYNYSRAVDLYKKALLMHDEKNYQAQLPAIYTKLAHAYQKNADYEKALEYYNIAKDYYEKEKEFLKVNYLKFNIAKVYYETYKIDSSKKILLEIVNSPESPPSLIVKSYIQLANSEEDLPDLQQAFLYYKKAIEYSDETMNPEILSELYFKYALTMDDKNDAKTAIEFYNKCINLNKDLKSNKFISPAYSNIATLYLEKNDIDNAIENYTRAYQIDKESNNLEGIYYSSSKLASILQRKLPEEALEYFYTALDCAKLMKDAFYVVSANLAIGDFHYDKNKNEIALKYYINALNLAQNNFSTDNINKINVRINDIKFKIGIEKFEKLLEIIREQEEENE